MRRRRGRWIAIIGAAVTTVVLVLFVTADVARPLDADLDVELVPLTSVESNGYVHYQRAARQLVTPSRGFMAPGFRSFRESGDLAWVDVLLENRGALASLEQALDAPRFVVPPVWGPASPIPSLLDARNCADLLRMKARLLSGAGRHRDALETCLAIVKLGHVFQSENAVLMTAMIGASVQRMGYDEIEVQLRQGQVPAELVAEFLPRFRALSVQEAELRGIIQREYGLVTRYLESWGERSIVERVRMAGGAAIFFKPQLTRRRWCDLHRAAVRDVSRPVSEHGASELARAQRDGAHWRRYFGGNAFGESLVDAGFPYYSALADLVAVSRRYEVVMACYVYAGRHGELPGSLENLVPDLLPEIPADPFDGATVRYRPASGVVYTIDHDLRDDGVAGEDGAFAGEDEGSVTGLARPRMPNPR